jgi:hypothetical protein
MDYKFLNKVVDQLVSETRVDYDKERLYTPFYSSLFPPPLSVFYLTRSPFLLSFTKHCKEVYSLNEQEIEYVWEEYRRIIKDMLPY